MEKETLRLVAAVVDKTQCTVYLEDGSTLHFNQGDARVRQIVDQAIPQLRKPGDVATVVFEQVENHYQTFEKKSNGLVKFFRVAKVAMVNFFKEVEPVKEQVIGTTKKADEVSEAKPVEAKQERDAHNERVARAQIAAAEVMKHAVPVSAKDFSEEGVKPQTTISGHKDVQKAEREEDHTHTIIATVGDKIIPGMEKIKTQIDRASKLGSTQGVEKFLARMATIVNQRRHSVEDLLKFMERGDLPIADDGSIVIYKVLKLAHGSYVDCHSRKVTQKVGSLVCMDPSMVDHNRSKECSNGLHVARRHYVNGFSGDVCVIAKVAPEDVIAVPSYDANKMRVCAYHIVHELKAKHYQALNAGRPITGDEEGQVVLAKILAGNHVGILEEVRITGSMGGGLVITPRGTQATPVSAPVEAPAVVNTPVASSELDHDSENDLDEEEDDEEGEAEAAPVPVVVKVVPPVIVKAVALEDLPATGTDEPVDVRAVSQAVAKLKGPSKAEQARTMFDAMHMLTGEAQKAKAVELQAFKKAAKKSWEVLGIQGGEAIVITKLAE